MRKTLEPICATTFQIIVQCGCNCQFHSNGGPNQSSDCVITYGGVGCAIGSSFNTWQRPNTRVQPTLLRCASQRGRTRPLGALASRQRQKFKAMKTSLREWLSWMLITLGLIVAACTSNASPIQSPISPMATATEKPTPPTPLPTSTIVPPTVTPQIIPTASFSSGICKSTNYCPLTD